MMEYLDVIPIMTNLYVIIKIVIKLKTKYMRVIIRLDYMKINKDVIKKDINDI